MLVYGCAERFGVSPVYLVAGLIVGDLVTTEVMINE